MVTTRPPKTIVKPTALGPVANTDTKLLIYGLFQKGRVLVQDGEVTEIVRSLESTSACYLLSDDATIISLCPDARYVSFWLAGSTASSRM